MFLGESMLIPVDFEKDIIFDTHVKSNRRVKVPKQKLDKSPIKLGDIVRVFVRPAFADRERDGLISLFFNLSDDFVQRRKLTKDGYITIPKHYFRFVNFEPGDKVLVLLKYEDDN